MESTSIIPFLSLRATPLASQGRYDRSNLMTAGDYFVVRSSLLVMTLGVSFLIG
jgi:hypothetical protein